MLAARMSILQDQIVSNPLHMTRHTPSTTPHCQGEGEGEREKDRERERGREGEGERGGEGTEREREREVRNKIRHSHIVLHFHKLCKN